MPTELLPFFPIYSFDLIIRFVIFLQEFDRWCRDFSQRSPTDSNRFGYFWLICLSSFVVFPHFLRLFCRWLFYFGVEISVLTRFQKCWFRFEYKFCVQIKKYISKEWLITKRSKKVGSLSIGLTDLNGADDDDCHSSGDSSYHHKSDCRNNGADDVHGNSNQVDDNPSADMVGTFLKIKINSFSKTDF